jgi:glycosyltransferase involved in cell wall biosynthesis
MPTPSSGRRLTVLSVAYPLAPVGPDTVGGAEQVLSSLDRALVEAGHRSIVVACEGSEVAGELVGIPAVHDAAIDDAISAAQHAAVRTAVAAILRREAVDLVHLHGLDFHAYLPLPGPPALVTLHLPPEWYPPEALRPTRPNTWLNCVSETQHRVLLALLEWDGRIKSGHGGVDSTGRTEWVLPPIANGVPVEALGGSRHARRNFALVLGRICREKGQHLALDAARLAGVPLLLAGQVFPYPEHTAYFEEAVRPRLGPPNRFIGALGFARKRRLLSAVRCLLLPSQVAETSSLVAMEAVACGTPVIAFDTGAVREIVEHGRTGFLVRDVAGMAEAIGAAGSIDPEYCRRVAHQRFSFKRTMAAYLNLYLRLAARGEASPEQLSAAAS